LGDLGGLFDALYLILYVIVAPVASHSLRSTILSNIFRYKPSDDASIKEQTQNFKEKRFLNDFIKGEERDLKSNLVSTILRDFKVS